MNYNELKSIAQPHLREGDDLPSNAFLLLNQLHIPFKSKGQCEVEYSSKMTPLYNTPAYLDIDVNGNKTIYFNDNTKYWNFYIFHEIAHYLLGHEDDSPQHEIEADLLACILAAPIENLPSNLKSARDLSILCKIPIDKSEAYWEEIKDNFLLKDKKVNFWKYSTFLCIGLIAIYLIISILGLFECNNKNEESSVIHISQYQGTVPAIKKNSQENSTANNEVNESDILDGNAYYVTSSGTKYHKAGCQYINGKSNLIPITLEEAKKSAYTPCLRCID